MRILLALAVLAIAPATASADTDLGPLERDTTVATWGGRAVWSAYNAENKRFELMTWTAAGGVEKVPVPLGEAPFDADLGPAPDGSHRAVYSRAGTIHAFDFTSGRETDTGLRGTRPHVWWDRVTFVSGRSLRQRIIGTDWRRTIFKRLPKGFRRFDVGRSVMAYATTRRGGDRTVATLRMRSLRTGSEQRVLRTSSGLLSSAGITGVNFVGFQQVGAVKFRRAAEGNRVIRFRWGAKRPEQATGRKNVLDGGLVGGGRLLYLQAGGETDAGCEAGCRLRVSDPLSF